MSGIRIRWLIICSLCVCLFFVSAVKRHSAVTQQVAAPFVLASQWNAVSEIKLSCNGEKVRLILNDNRKWYFELTDGTAVPADINIIKRFTSVLTDVRELYPLSRRQSNWDTYGLDEKSADTVTLLTAGQEVISQLYFGRERFAGSEIAVRTGRDISSWTTRNDIGSFLTCQARDWCQMDLTPFTGKKDFADSIQYVAVQTNDDSFVLQRRIGTVWNMDGRGSVSDRNVSAWLRQFCLARGSDVLVSSYHTGNTVGIITFIDGNGTEYSFTICSYDADNTQFAFFNNADFWGFTISRWTKERLLPPAAIFLR